MTSNIKKRLTLAAAAAALSVWPIAAHADVLTAKAADPTEQGNGRMSTAARAAMNRGALPMNAAEVAAKAAATRASQAALGANSAPASAGPLAVVSGGHNFAGQFNATSAPPDTTGAIGTTRYIELVNTRYGIYNRTTNALINSGTLNTLAGLAANVNTFDPQIIWDAQTNRFYYFNDSIFSDADNRLSWGFSKTDSPADGSAAHWCKYTTGFGTRFPDYPKLGDSQHFLIVGVNSFTGNSFSGSDIVSFSKPPAGTACPAANSFKINRITSITDPGGSPTFTPTPSNQIDTNATGYVVARNGGLPSNKLWFRSVTRNAATGFAVYGGPRGATVAAYTFPPNAPSGAGGPRLLDTLDARPTQAVQSINPDRGTFSFWVQHTIANGALSGVRWYEINPVPAVPAVLRQGNIFRAGTFLFNAAISSDRKVRTGFPSTFGDNFAIHYSVTKSTAPAINPRIEAASSVNGGIVGGFVVLQSSPAPYVDFTCPNPGNTCRWGDYAAANPDPVPPTTDRGVVWGANEWGSGSQSTAGANWRTKIFALRP